jgi:hypothetical protein
MKLLFALPGFHRYDRGAEVALLSVARELARSGEDVTVAGSGGARPDVPYALPRSTLDPAGKFRAISGHSTVSVRDGLGRCHVRFQPDSADPPGEL